MIVAELPEHRELRDAVRKALARTASSAGVSDTGDARGLWKRLADEIGIAGLTIPEEFGGAGATAAELAVVAEEMGRCLAPAPYISTLGLAAELILKSGHRDIQATWLPQIASGETIAAVAYRGLSGEIDPDRLSVTADPEGERWRLTGELRFVIEGDIADLLLVFARTIEAGPALFLLRADELGVSCRTMETLDPSRSQATIRLERATAELVGIGRAAWTWLLDTVDQATVLLSAEQLGGAERALEMSVEYAKLRAQFGRPIASFQAIKHRCADLAVEVDRARSAVTHATWAASDPQGANSLGAAASVAALVCGETFDRTSQENIQIHGGIGFTYEHSAHRFFRRAKADAVALADRPYYVERLLLSVGATDDRPARED